MFEHRSKLLGLSCLAHDLALASVVFSLAYWIRDQLLPRLDSTSFQPIHPFAYYLPILLGVLALWTATGYVLGIYRKVELRSPAQIIWDEVRLIFTAMILINAGLYLLRAD